MVNQVQTSDFFRLAQLLFPRYFYLIFRGSQARPALLRASEGRRMGGGPVEFNCESPPAFRSAPLCSGADSVAVFSHFSGSQARPALLRASDSRRMGGGPV